MRALDKKLLRDVWRMRVHALGVALVLGCGLSVMVMAIGMRGSMERTRAAYYAERYMADLAVSAVLRSALHRTWPLRPACRQSRRV
jgi:putative ABC transport system permease protein